MSKLSATLKLIACGLLCLSVVRAQTPAPGTMLISEFRTSGAGANFGAQIRDEYVELYNNTVTTEDLQGYYLQFSDGANDFVLGPITTPLLVPPRGHALFVNAPGYSLSSYAAGNFDVASGDTTADIFTENQGVALFFGDPVGVNLRIDAVGFTGNNTTYREGAGLPVFSGGGFTPPGVQHAFARRLESGLPQDTNNNAADFVLVAPSGGVLSGVQSTLGAPGPENSMSPVQQNAQIKAALIDPQCPTSGTAASACARVRDTAPVTNGAQGTLDLRRTFTNHTGQTVTALRFRVVNITTQGNQAAGEADLRAIDGADIVVTRADNTTVTARGLVVETPPMQASGGGLNASLAPSTAPPLADGAPISMHFLIGVQQGGNYRYFVNVEALPAPPGAPVMNAAKTDTQPTLLPLQRRLLVHPAKSQPRNQSPLTMRD